MSIRCGHCMGIVAVESLIPGNCPPSITCKSCDAGLSLMSCGELGLTADEQSERASQYAGFNKIDIPSANSVLLGLMTLEQAQRLGAPDADRLTGAQTKPEAAATVTPVAPSAPTAAAVEGPRKPSSIDAGFRRAVEEGQMTAEQAMQRGDRRLFATQLARRHGLPMRLATLVADNKMSLHAATQRVRPAVPRPQERPVTGRQKTLMISFAAVLLIGVVAQVRSQLEHRIKEGRAAETNQLASATALPVEEPAPPVSALPGTMSIETDDEGNPLRIEGNTPRTILEAYCSNGPQASRFEPLDLANSVPPTSGARLGVIRNFDDFDGPYVIDILRDRDSGRWVAGDGEQPILPRPAPRALAEGAPIAASF